MFGLWEYKESNGSQKEESLQNTHQLGINWEGLYPNTIPDLDAPFNIDYYYYTDDILQNSYIPLAVMLVLFANQKRKTESLFFLS